MPSPLVNQRKAWALLLDGDLNRTPLHMEAKPNSPPDIWWVLGLALLLRILLPIAGYFHTLDVTIFYTPDTVSYVVRPAN
jgi:hypothetical protein